jgi:hypothetical protein
MTPKVKPPGTKRLKLKCDILLSNCSFEIKLRRYTKDRGSGPGKKLCIHWAKNGKCQHGDKCHYMHDTSTAHDKPAWA